MANQTNDRDLPGSSEDMEDWLLLSCFRRLAWFGKPNICWILLRYAGNCLPVSFYLPDILRANKVEGHLRQRSILLHDKDRLFEELIRWLFWIYCLSVLALHLFDPTEFCVLSGVPRKKSPHCIGHGKAIFRSLFEKIHRSFTFPRLRCLFASLRKSPSI